MFFNLIDNAVRYTPQGGEIQVSLSRKDGDACVAIKDNGIGIPPFFLFLLRASVLIIACFVYQDSV